MDRLEQELELEALELGVAGDVLVVEVLGDGDRFPSAVEPDAE
ncbi:MAG TPA: hypothetical protein VK874_04135 [Gaiellaceae bacterium]|nr:hypothetical protein [Gaiellaceae bacterium]